MGCIVQWCMPLFMQEHQQDVYNSIHTGNTQYFVPIHIYIETHELVLCVSPFMQVMHKVCYMSVPIHIYRTHTRCVMSYIHAQKEGLVMRIYIKHYCAFTAEILCV